MTNPSFRLDGKVAIVTGASSGLGVRFAQTLARAGADVVLAARRLENLQRVQAEIESLGQRCVAVQTDVSDQADCARLVDRAVDELGDVHVLVNNAGTSHTQPAHHEDPDDFDRVLGVNLAGSYYVARAFGSHCITQGHGGSIVNVSSVLGLSGGEIPQAAYSASKAGILGLTRDLSMQWAGRKGIRVNSLAPGYFDSELTAPLREQPKLLEQILQRTPMHRLGDPGELDGPLLLLASDAGSYITGVTLAVDGGWSLH